MVRSVHAQQVALAGQEVGHLGHVVSGPADESLGVVGQGGAVAVTHGEVLGADRRAVRCFPHEGVLRHLRRHTAPNDGVTEPGQTQDLWHLRDVAEHVREVPDVHHAPEGSAPHQAHLQVAHDGLTGGQELVHQDVPGAHAEPPRRSQGTQPPLGLRTDLEVVVDHGHLPVEHEVGVARIVLEERDQRVDQLDERQTEVLVGLVPFPVPVRVRNDDNPTGGHDRQTMTNGRGR